MAEVGTASTLDYSPASLLTSTRLLNFNDTEFTLSDSVRQERSLSLTDAGFPLSETTIRRERSLSLTLVSLLAPTTTIRRERTESTIPHGMDLSPYAEKFPTTVYRMCGYRPNQNDYEYWTAISTPNTNNPSGQPILFISICGVKLELTP